MPTILHDFNQLQAEFARVLRENCQGQRVEIPFSFSPGNGRVCLVHIPIPGAPSFGLPTVVVDTAENAAAPLFSSTSGDDGFEQAAAELSRIALSSWCDRQNRRRRKVLGEWDERTKMFRIRQLTPPPTLGEYQIR